MFQSDNTLYRRNINCCRLKRQHRMKQNISTLADDENDEYEFDYTLSDIQLVIFGFFIFVIILTAVIGNILTIFSFIRDKQLHTVYNIYIVNLATNDFLSALFTMVLYGMYTLLQYKWILGYHLCKILYVISRFVSNPLSS
ncbi:LOW QUALITY PROTEIN: hypothetical protein KUTeg_024566 [Tegillarca granosa]|uniref:G-protein coupled receptors family 1 profile domain-containing protein n=1 Tax=Tegillarca granosa TaxID=220873 RepID=A0ABQ9E3D2_TEGGR|nr:LOW QUALITY PROTEIN: hypothetical protein KUTeg_024566 [Tegillarca granosa]